MRLANKIINPNFVNPDEARFKKYQQLLNDYIAAIPENVETVDILKIKSDVLNMGIVGITESDVTVEKLTKLAQKAGLKIIYE